MKVVDHELISDIHQKLIARISVSARAGDFACRAAWRRARASSPIVMDAIERRDADMAAQSLTAYVLNAADAALKRLDATRAAPRAAPRERNRGGTRRPAC